MDELSNKVAIVTGSTKGIGKSIAEVFSQKGANVVVTSRNLSLAKEIVKNLNSYDTDPIAIKTDVTIDDDISNLIQTTKDHYGKIDILINNAGYPLTSEYWDSSFTDISLEGYKNVIDADLLGSIRCCKAVIPIMKNCENLINNIGHSPPDIIYSISKISTLIVTNDTGPGHIAALSGSNILWLVNDNKVTKANISNETNNYKISSSYVNNITTQEVINFIEKKKLL